MNTVAMVIALAFVVTTVAAAVVALFEMSPFGRHSDHYRDPLTGKRRWEAPNLEEGPKW